MNVSEIIILGVATAGLLGQAVAIAATRVTAKRVTALRARNIYPDDGKACDDDVRRLLDVGEEIMAIRCYRQVHNVGLKEAKDAVDALKARGSART